MSRGEKKDFTDFGTVQAIISDVSFSSPQQSEDKAMYDAREKAIRDENWRLNAARREGEIQGEVKGKIEGEIKLIRTLQGILCVPVSEEEDLRGMTLEQLEALTGSLQEKIRNRPE